jgi:hypothetical protein
MTGFEQSPQHLREVALQLPKHVLPMYEFAEKTSPYAIFVCDRDARPIGAALEAIRGYTNGLPSVEDRLYYKRISKRVPTDALVEHLRDLLESLQHTASADSRLMVVDDYVSNGAGTLHLFRGICRKLDITMPIDWVTLSGKGTAFNVFPYLGPTASAPWRDRPDVIGLNYDGTKLTKAPTVLSDMFYGAIHEGVKRLFEEDTSLVS